MSLHHDDPFDPSKPALIVIVGNTARKHRALDREAILLGRAHGCDIGLSAPDISSIHCLIYRGPAGFRIRDCQSRSGTHLNGRAIQEEDLRDGDTIQVGPFSFQTYLPLGTASPADAEIPAANTSARQVYLERSRRRGIQLAVRLRQRLRDARKALEVTTQEQTTLAQRQAELDEQAEFLRSKAREYEQRARKLEEAERALAHDRAALQHEVDERERQLGQREHEQAERHAFLGLLREELAGHRQLTGVELPPASCSLDTPIPGKWPNLLGAQTSGSS